MMHRIQVTYHLEGGTSYTTPQEEVDDQKLQQTKAKLLSIIESAEYGSAMSFITVDGKWVAFDGSLLRTAEMRFVKDPPEVTPMKWAYGLRINK